MTSPRSKQTPAIISASRRTDIPAFYTEWLMNRIRAGVVAVPNPMNSKQISWVSLDPRDVRAIVFWTKNARPLLPHLDELDARGYHYYFQYTMTGYPPVLEPGTPPWEGTVDTMKILASRLGPLGVVWRYDPIIFTTEFDEQYHLATIEMLANALEGTVSRLVFSFVDLYRKAQRNLDRASHGSLGNCYGMPLTMTPREFATALAAIGARHGLEVQSCAEALDFTGTGVTPGRCIDADLIARLFGGDNGIRKDTGQREACGCAQSREIGMYDSCLHGCVYCYANLSDEHALANRRHLHNPKSASLLGWIDPDAIPAQRQDASVGKAADQLTLGVGRDSNNNKCGGPSSQ